MNSYCTPVAHELGVEVSTVLMKGSSQLVASISVDMWDSQYFSYEVYPHSQSHHTELHTLTGYLEALCHHQHKHTVQFLRFSRQELEDKERRGEGGEEKKLKKI